MRLLSSAQTISCSFNLTGNTLVPASVYREDQQHQYLSFNFEMEAGHKATSDELSFIEARNVYSLPESSTAINAIFPKCRFFHESTVEIELAMRLARVSNRDSAFLFFSKNLFRLLIIRNDKLELANTFRFGSEMDVAYYVLYVFDQLGIKKSAIEVFASGEIDENRAELNLLREYIGKVQLLRNSSLADIPDTADHPADTLRFFTLFHQVLLCES